MCTSPTPPGFEHRKIPRLVKPDVQKIDARQKQLGLSEQQFAEKCGRGDAGFYRHWKKGRKCYVWTLVRVAKVLGLRNWWEIWADYVPPAPATVILTLDECLAEDLCVKTLLNPTTSLTATGQPVGTTNFLEQVREKFPNEIAPIINQSEVIQRVLLNLESMGWLIANDDGTFSRRYWTLRECMAAIEIRCGAEDGAMLAVAMLQDPNRRDFRANMKIYKKIMQDQGERLARMKLLDKLVNRDRDDEAAATIIAEDDAFHRRWPFVPCAVLSYGFALRTIDQSTNRFIETLKRCKERGIEVPSDFPTLPSLVQNYYQELNAIFNKFTMVKPNDVDAMVEIRQMLRTHAHQGYNTASGAETLIARWPRRPNT